MAVPHLGTEGKRRDVGDTEEEVTCVGANSMQKKDKIRMTSLYVRM